MGYLSIKDGEDKTDKNGSYIEEDSLNNLQKCFMVLDFETRFLGILAGYDFDQATTMPFTQIKGARNVGKSSVTKRNGKDPSDGSSNQNQFWTLEF